VKIRVKRAFGEYKVGQVFDWPRGMSRLMIARGMIEEVIEAAEEKPPVLEAAADTTKPTRRKKK
jgi:hypothetical protein